MGRFYTAPKHERVEDFLFTPPFELIGKGLEKKEATAQKTTDLMEIMSDVPVEFVTGSDEKVANRIKDEYAEAVSEVAGIDPNDPKFYQSIYKLRKKIQKDAETGTIKQLSNKSAKVKEYLAAVAGLDKESDKAAFKNVLAQNAAESSALDTFTDFNAPDLYQSKGYSVEEFAKSDIFKSLVPNETLNTDPPILTKDGYFFKTTDNKTVKVTEERIKDAYESWVKGNPDVLGRAKIGESVFGEEGWLTEDGENISFEEGSYLSNRFKQGLSALTNKQTSNKDTYLRTNIPLPQEIEAAAAAAKAKAAAKASLEAKGIASYDNSPFADTSETGVRDKQEIDVVKCDILNELVNNEIGRKLMKEIFVQAYDGMPLKGSISKPTIENLSEFSTKELLNFMSTKMPSKFKEFYNSMTSDINPNNYPQGFTDAIARVDVVTANLYTTGNDQLKNLDLNTKDIEAYVAAVKAETGAATITQAPGHLAVRGVFEENLENENPNIMLEKDYVPASSYVDKIFIRDGKRYKIKKVEAKNGTGQPYVRMGITDIDTFYPGATNECAMTYVEFKGNNIEGEEKTEIVTFTAPKVEIGLNLIN